MQPVLLYYPLPIDLRHSLARAFSMIFWLTSPASPLVASLFMSLFIDSFNVEVPVLVSQCFFQNIVVQSTKTQVSTGSFGTVSV